jgi:hypothetical protein
MTQSNKGKILESGRFPNPRLSAPAIVGFIARSKVAFVRFEIIIELISKMKEEQYMKKLTRMKISNDSNK